VCEFHFSRMKNWKTMYL